MLWPRFARKKNDRLSRGPERRYCKKPLRRSLSILGPLASTLNELGEIVTKRVFTDTPRSGMPGAVMDIIAQLAEEQEEYDRVSVGFPGIVQNGVVQAAPNLAPEWKHFNIAKILSARLRKPVRVANDADVQGFGAISGVGVELVLTVGTGVGSALFLNGHLIPNVEVGKDKLSAAELRRVGKKKWNRRLQKLIRKLEAMFYYDRLYIGGGETQSSYQSLTSHRTSRSSPI